MRYSQFLTFAFLFLFFSCKEEKKEQVEFQKIDEVKSKEIPSEKELETLVVTDRVSKKALVGEVNFQKDSSFVKLPSYWVNKPTFLRKEVAENFLKMAEAAKKDSVDLKVISGARTFGHQKAIWDRKWNRYAHLSDSMKVRKIMRYSSMPKTSRHHWGTEVDLNSLTNKYFESGKGKQVYDWLQENAESFGFFQVYTDKSGGRKGYNEEKWHWSYFPLSDSFLFQYNSEVSDSLISGFLGSELYVPLKIKEEFVNGIAER